MKKIYLTITMLFVLAKAFSQHTQTYTTTVAVTPENGKGLEGTINVFYAFANCFNDAVIAYGYNDINIVAYHNEGKRYTEADLGIQFSNSKYVQTTSISSMEVTISFNGAYIETKTLTTTLPKFDTGCYGQTKKIGSYKANGLDGWEANFVNAKLSATYALALKVEAFEANKKNQETYNELMRKAYNESKEEEKLNILKSARRYVSDDQKEELENAIKNLETKIAQEKEDLAIKEQNDIDNNVENPTNQYQEETPTKSQPNTTQENEDNKYRQVLRDTNLNSEKTKAIAATVGASALMASQASRFGMGVDYNFGTNIESYAPVLYFMFDENNGMNISYGIDTQEPLNIDSTRDAYDIRIGYVYDFDNQIDALGIGFDVHYAKFQENNIRETPFFSTYKEGSQINFGVSAHLWLLKFGYSLPISYSGFEERLIDGERLDFEASGIFTAGLYFFF